MPKKEDPLIRFHRKYKVDLETNCWIWTDKPHKTGYAYLRVYDKNMKAHRFSYETFVGPLNPKLEICHQCNNKLCLNPKHLRQDTRSSNQIDISKVKGRKNQKLTFEEVIEIKKALKKPYWGIGKYLSDKYGVTRCTITEIKKNEKWKHLTID
jgi:predicted metal-binding protein